jgi:Flp pilus assembly pilin Flp
MRLQSSYFKMKQATKYCLDNLFLKMYVRLCEKQSGQTLAEYALIFAALSIAAFVAYQSIGNSVVVLGNGLSSELTSV